MKVPLVNLSWPISSGPWREDQCCRGRPSLRGGFCGCSSVLGFPAAEGIKGSPEQPVSCLCCYWTGSQSASSLHNKRVFLFLTRGAMRTRETVLFDVVRILWAILLGFTTCIDEPMLPRHNWELMAPGNHILTSYWLILILIPHWCTFSPCFCPQCRKYALHREPYRESASLTGKGQGMVQGCTHIHMYAYTHVAVIPRLDWTTNAPIICGKLTPLKTTSTRLVPHWHLEWQCQKQNAWPHQGNPMDVWK